MTSNTILPILGRIQNDFKVILASGSPRRKELLTTMGINKFDIIVSNFAENFDIASFPRPEDYCLRTSLQKVADVCNMIGSANEQYLVIGADTIVAVDGVVLEKPKDDIDAKRMLKLLSGKEHNVHTAVTIFSNFFKGDQNIAGGNFELATSFVETTKVKFTELSDLDIDAYVAFHEGIDKAGSYGIQGLGGQMVEGIQGCYFNVMGFPIHAVSSRLSLLFKDHRPDII